MNGLDEKRTDSELQVARKIQFSLLPAAFPAHSVWREYDLFAQLRPAREIGGDYYDFFSLDADRLVVAIGDVSGKGMPAALYMAVCRTAFRALAAQADTPGSLLTGVNDMLSRDNTSGHYVTAACFFLDMPTGQCRYAIAGHPAPILLRSGSREATLLDNPRETLIGMKAGVLYPNGVVRLSPGDTLLLFTDGITEVKNAADRELEHDGLFQLFTKASALRTARDIILHLDAAVREYAVDGAQLDDMTLLALRYWGPGGENMATAANRAGTKDT